MNDVCVSCHYARMRRDICGIYCVGKHLKKEDGTCVHYLYYRKAKKGKVKTVRNSRNMMLRCRRT